jgi:hypothetical protein
MDFVDILDWLDDLCVTYWSVDRNLSAFAQPIKII